jgi:hypothetical protein
MIRFSLISVIAFELLGRAAFGATAPELSTLLDRAGKRVEQFWEQFSAVSCLETVTQIKLSPEGKVLTQRKATFDYLIMMQLTGEDLTVDESRLIQGKPPKAADRALLSTSGFSTLMLILHPLFQPSFEFSAAVEETLDGMRLQRVHFEHIRGRRSPSVLQLKGREYPIEWQGDVWMHPLSGHVFKIAVALRAPMADVGLQRLSSDVHYTPVPLKGLAEPAWLPEAASIEAGTQRQRWKNMHQFTRFRQFSVDTDVKTEAPKQ